MKILTRAVPLALIVAGLVTAFSWAPAAAQERVVKIADVGAMSGVIRGLGSRISL